MTGCFGSYPIGHLTRIVKGDTATTYCYDAHGNVSRKTQQQSGAVDAVAYSYTPADRLQRVTYPDGAKAAYVYDTVGRVLAIQLQPADGTSVAAVSDTHYLPFGPIASYKLGNGQVVTSSYDADYRMTDLASPLLQLHYARDALGNITAMGDAAGATPATESYRYDALQRLTAVNEADGSTLERYTYNKTGDRLSKTGTGQATGPYGYADGTHHLISVGTDPYTVDPNGETTSIQRDGQTLVLTYNERHRLSMVVGGTGSNTGAVQIPYNSHAANGMAHSHAGGNGNEIGHAQSPNAGRMVKSLSTTYAYTYNAEGERIRKTAIGGTGAISSTRFVYDEGAHLLNRSRSDGTRDYVWLDGMPVALVDTPAGGGLSTPSYVIDDDLGTPRVVVDVAGNELWRWERLGNPYGEMQPISASGFVFNLRFPGQYFDQETGFAYNLNRDYGAAIGRYLESDPIGLRAGLNTYNYVSGNPLSYQDTHGLAKQDYTIEPAVVSPEVLAAEERLQSLANIAASHVDATCGWRCSLPWIRGTLIHSEFKRLVDSTCPKSEFTTEVSYKDGVPVPYGTKGSSRADVVFGPVSKPLNVFDLKTGWAYLSIGQAKAHGANLPPLTTFSVIRPDSR